MIKGKRFKTKENSMLKNQHITCECGAVYNNELTNMCPICRLNKMREKSNAVYVQNTSRNRKIVNK